MFTELDSFETVDDTALANVVGGRRRGYKRYKYRGRTSFAYGVYYNPRTGRTYVDPAGFARTWANNIVGLHAGSGARQVRRARHGWW